MFYPSDVIRKVELYQHDADSWDTGWLYTVRRH